MSRKIDKSNVQDILELSMVQKGMLFHYLKESDENLYNVQLSFDIKGSLNVEVLKASIKFVISSNEALRSVFSWEKISKPVQIILKECEADFSLIDIADEAIENIENLINRYTIQDQEERFDLTGLPVRIKLIKTGADSFVLNITHHHILYDGWSTGIFLKELFYCYNQLAKGQPPVLDRRPAYKQVQLAFQKKEEPEKTKSFWSGYLKDHERTALVTGTGAVPGVNEPVQKVNTSLANAKIDAFSAQHKVTKAAIIYAAYGILLQKYTDVADVVFGTTVSYRDTTIEGSGNIIGNFINTIPMRLTNFTDQSLLEVVNTVSHDLINRNEYNNSSYYEIKKILDLKPDENLFDSVIVIENYPLDTALIQSSEAFDVQLRSVYENTGVPVLFTVFFKEELEIELAYKTSTINGDFAKALVDDFATILLAIVEDVNQTVSGVSLLSAIQQEQLLKEFNDTAVVYPKEKTLIELFEQQVIKTPGAIALDYNNQELTYQELNEKANSLAELLRAQGIRQNDVVALYLNRSLEMFIGIIGVLKSGGCYLPLDPSYPRERLEYMLADSKASVMVTAGETKSADLAGANDIVTLNIDWNTLAENPENLKNINNSEDLAYLIYTSGSTGKPKGVMLSHRAVHNYIIAMLQGIAFDQVDTLISVTAFSFDIFVTESLLPLTQGLRVIIADEFAQQDPARLTKLIADKNVQLIQTTPSRYRLLTSNIDDFNLCKSHLCYLLAGGEALDQELFLKLKAHSAAKIINVYGPTETTVWSAMMDLTEQEKVTIGKPIANTQLYVLNKQLQLQPIGISGELYIGGDGLAHGYWNNVELTTKTFIQNPFDTDNKIYKTGDIVRWMKDGTIEYLGRADQQVKIRGHRIEMDEIRYEILGYDGISEVAVVAKEMGHDKSLVAYYVAEQAVDAMSLKRFLADKIPYYMVPAYYVQLDKMPLTPNGKLDKKSLPDPQSDLETVYTAPAYDTETELLKIWSEVLGHDKISTHANFFDIGGDSLSIINVSSKIKKVFNKEVSVTELFNYSTIASLANFINPEQAFAVQQALADQEEENELIKDTDIAIIGMACRFPGAGNIEEYWQNLQSGTESIVRKDTPENSTLIYAKGTLANYEKFDAAFFNYIPSEAGSMDPQIRLFHECTWESLEHAGYNPYNYTGAIGLYGGASTNPSYNININEADDHNWIEKWEGITYADKDFMCPRVSYKLNLKGPSLNIATACSTSLVAVDTACQELLSQKCDIAVAGGVSVTTHDNDGYKYHKSMIWSPDGKCRAFDEQSGGTVGGNGVGTVVLKRLARALRDGDVIHAVIKATATNNDGNRKVGFTAPSIEGQAKAIDTAIRKARIPAESIGMIEAHGTGTSLGDPIEIEGLRQAFNTDKRQYCAIGSVKTNIGHLDAAAGIAGLIKAVLSIKYRQLPPSLHYKSPNPKINFLTSPFYVNTTLKEWENTQYPLRAGVSSFGIGGTNAHVILEEAPEAVTSDAGREQHLLIFSGKNEEALKRNLEKYKTYFTENPAAKLADVSYTLQTGRAHFNYRQSLVCSTADEALEALKEQAPVSKSASGKQPIVFMFSGQGSQYTGMYQELYENEAVFRSAADACFAIVAEQSGMDLKAVIYPEGASALNINDTCYAQPALFIMEYALSCLLLHWGIKPAMLIGHSIGEYVAACISGVWGMEDALKLVIKRGALMQQVKKGQMLSVSISELELRDLLRGEPAISLAAVNSNSLSVVSGEEEPLMAFATKLTTSGYKNKVLHTSHAFHSWMMDGILAEFEKAFEGINFKPQQIPVISNLTGEPAKDSEIGSPAYWVKHLRNEVRFSAGAGHILQQEQVVFIELGPGNALSTFVRSHQNRTRQHKVISMISSAAQVHQDQRQVLKGLGELWENGVRINWETYYQDEQRQKLALPAYSFDQVAYPVSLQQSVQSISKQKTSIVDQFYTPDLKDSALSYLIFADEYGVGKLLAESFNKEDIDFIYVTKGTAYLEKGNNQYELNPESAAGYEELFSSLHAKQIALKSIVYGWAIKETLGLQRTTIDFDMTASDLQFVNHIIKSTHKINSSSVVPITFLTGELYEILVQQRIDIAIEASTLMKPGEEKQVSHTVENQMITLWENFFGISDITYADDFFELGGDSLKALVMIGRIHRLFGIEISITEFFNCSSVRLLSENIKNKINQNEGTAIQYQGLKAAAVQEYYTLSSVQQRLYFQYKFDQNSLSYNLPYCFVMEGEVDYSKLNYAFTQIIERHESLRTRFVEIEGTPFQQIIADPAFTIETLECNTAQLQAVIKAFIRPFDLNNEALIRVAVATTEAQQLLMIDMHHIITDGVSHGIFIKEFMQLYNNEVLQPLKLQYKDFSAWQQSADQQEKASGHQQFWLDQFAAAVPVLEIPADFNRPMVQEHQGHVLNFSIGKEDTQQLKLIAESQGATLFMLLLSAYNILLSKLSNSADIVVGTPANGRQHADLENMMGMFVNTLPMRNAVKAEWNFQEFLASVKEHTLKAFEHQAYPYEKLIDDLGVVRSTGRNPLFDVMFAYQNFEKSELSANGLRLTEYSAGHITSIFDLNLLACERNGELLLDLIYSPALFTRDTIEKYTGYFNQILSAVIADPQQKIADIAILSMEERELLLNEFNNTFDENNPDKETIISMFEKQVATTPDAIALVFKDQNISYLQLNAKVNAIAQKIGFDLVEKENKKIALLFDPSIEMIASILAVLRLGGIYVPLSPESPADRNSYILSNCDCGLLLIQDAVFDQDYIDLLSAATANVKLISTGYDQVAYQEYPAVDVLPDDSVYIIYTSGTTGMPKGVEIRHKGLMNYVAWRMSNHKLTAKDVTLQLVSYHFDGFGADIYPSLLGGGKFIIIPKEERLNANYIINAIQTERVTNFAMTPGLYGAIINGLPAGDHFRDLRFVVLAGEKASRNLIQTSNRVLPHVLLENEYGPTESTVGVVHNDILDENNNAIIGKPIANTLIYILGKNNELLPLGFTGELCVSGIGIAKGYVNNEKLTSEKFIDNPFVAGLKIYKTGDQAKWLPDGQLEFLGRSDNQIKIRGFRVELEEIMSQLTLHPAIKESVIVVKEKAEGEKLLVAYYTTFYTVEVDELRSFLAAQLPNYMVPSYFMALEQMPITLVGKLDTKALPEITIQAGLDYVAPQTTEEKALSEVWSKVLGVERIGVTDNFFALGGDSIKSIQISSRMHALGYEVPVKEMFISQTITELSRKIRKTEILTDQAIVLGKVELTPIQQWFFDGSIVNKQHFNQSVMLNFADGITAGSVNTIFTKLLEHHDALRMVFSQRENQVIQEYQEPGLPLSLLVEDLSTADDPENSILLFAQQMQTGIELEHGPLVKLGLFQMKNGSRLLIVIHHLIIDGVSWRILFEDIDTLYKQLIAGEKLVLPLKTDSFQSWSAQLGEYVKSATFHKAKQYWNTILNTNKAAIRKDGKENSYQLQDVKRIEFVLSKKETSALLSRVNHAFGTQINDVLLAALGLSIRQQYGVESLMIDLESHGREQLTQHTNFGRTIGWFTSMYPVLLTITHEDLSAVLKQVKETLREIPNNGLDFLLLKQLTAGNDLSARSQICFNYLGQFDTDTAGNAYTIATEKKGNDIAGTESMGYDWDIAGIITGGQLKIALGYFEDQYTTTEISSFMGLFNQNLVEIITYCSAIEQTELTPSDLTYKGLTINQLEELQTQYAVENIYTLSPLQEGMLFHALIAPDSDNYFGQMTYRVTGQLDIQAVERSMNELFARYGILRTTFLHGTYERPLQLVQKGRKIGFQFHDIRMESLLTSKDEMMLQYRMEDRARKFNLSEDVLMRLSIYQTDTDEFEFIWSHHHILMDGWCMGIIIREFRTLYSHHKNQKEITLPKVRPYADYIQWLENRDQEVSVNYWKDYLSGYESLSSLPKKETLSTAKSFVPASEEFILDKEITGKLRKASAANGVTINTILQSAWGILLAAYNNTDDVLFGSIVSGRPAEIAGVESMVGLFINAIPFRLRIDKEETIRTLLQQVQNACLDNEAHQYVSLALIQSFSDLGPGLLDHILIFEDYPMTAEVQGADAEFAVKNVELFEQTNYDLSVMIAPADEITIKFDYNTDVYEGELIKQAARHFNNIIVQLADEDKSNITALEFVTTSEKHQLLHEFNTTAKEFDKRIFIDLFKDQVNKTPEAIAVVHNLSSLTYEELYHRSKVLALQLIKAGVKPGQKVALYMPRSIEMLVGILGVFQAGGGYVPIDVDYPKERIREILSGSETQVVLVTADVADEIDELRTSLPDLEQVICIDTLADPDEDAEIDQEGYGMQDLAYIIYTSGTTGKPKGVMIHQLGMINHIYSKIDDLKLDEHTVIAQSASPCFDISVWQFLTALLVGGKTHIIDKEILTSPKQLISELNRGGVTIFESVPSLMTTFLEEMPDHQDNSLKQLVWMIPTGEPLTISLVRKWYTYFPDIKLLNAYGPTEASDDITVHEVAYPEENQQLISIGKPIQNMKIYIVSKQLSLCPVGIEGEICVAGLGVGLGYYKDEEKTNKVFINNPFAEEKNSGYDILYKTGDIGYFTPTGDIICLGRIDHQVKIRGLRMELGEIENRLSAHELVQASTILAVKKNNDTYLVAYYQAEQEIDPAILKDFLLQTLPDYMVPAYYMQLERMPVTSNGKLNRKALPAYSIKQNDQDIRPANAVEEKLIGFWSEILNIDPELMNISSNFFDLGGHSLKAITLVNKIHKFFGAEVPLKEIFQKQSIENIADYLITVQQIPCEMEFEGNITEISI
ncbi:non-ribosomal peptide synthetase/type I polyketide synthase [Pedobacter cryoconitis]|uniref:non-ribosomal peptide synthetase/type I polyketide synthase n=1 Tax=Pedobacter cryoconitis TaxID=188932 RepID=UPI001618F729|nr:non-ribosomal peptide synthetase/type I polyketide synthase [Pedobacter cryoconitis]MBB5647627.1 amino acid adenylation domain-containing protein/non-ribosomal peptide synthase protein (TIGR01720 family) [Pedobacter cryoconitis]